VYGGRRTAYCVLQHTITCTNAYRITHPRTRSRTVDDLTRTRHAHAPSSIRPRSRGSGHGQQHGGAREDNAGAAAPGGKTTAAQHGPHPGTAEGTRRTREGRRARILYAVCTVYCVLFTVYCVLCTVCSVLCTVPRAAYWVLLCTVYCVLYRVPRTGYCCVLCTVYCVLCTVYCVLCTVYCVLCDNIKGTAHGAQLTLGLTLGCSNVYCVRRTVKCTAIRGGSSKRERRRGAPLLY
jgi:hypothetical protein